MRNQHHHRLIVGNLFFRYHTLINTACTYGTSAFTTSIGVNTSTTYTQRRRITNTQITMAPPPSSSSSSSAAASIPAPTKPATAAMATTTAFSSPSPAFQLSNRLNGLDKPTVWHEFSPLASQYGAVNLGQGFPDWDPPQFAIDALNTSIDPSSGRNANQYARSYAHMPLAQVLAEDYTKRLDIGRDIDPSTEVATAVGCTNALFCALQGMIGPGDEVLLLEPAFDVYIAQTQFAGGSPVFVPLRTAETETEAEAEAEESTSYQKKGTRMANDAFTLDLEELENAITDKTKAFILNTPHNPTGKMFTKTEMEGIASIMKRHPQVTIISDEVYEHIVFDKEASPHISMASLPGMYERTLTLSSSGKTFSATGWKVGWAVGPQHLVNAVTAVQQWVNFSAPTPNQDAIAQCLIMAREPYCDECNSNGTGEHYESFYAFVAAEYKRKRGLLVDALISAGMDPIVPNGGFFIMADTSDITFPTEYMEEKTVAMPCDPMPRDWAMSRWLTKEVGVTAIPPSAFYGEDTVHLAKNLLRFAYCKGDDTILEAHARLKKYFQK